MKKKNQIQSLFENQELLNIVELSQFLKVPEKTIRHWIYIGKVPHYKVGRHIRFAPLEIQNWIFNKEDCYEC